ncbi:MAG: DPP IV N-terminal domain-containing protein [Methanosarcinaceae archaeon]
MKGWHNRLKASFSPDGTKIIYDRENEIYIYDVETGEKRFITKGENPDWRP